MANLAIINFTILESDLYVIQSYVAEYNIYESFTTNIAETSTPTGKFFASCVILSSHEDAPAWASILKFVYDLGIRPS